MLAIVMVLLAQDLTGPPGDEPIRIPRLTATAPRDCTPGNGEDIVVCGQDQEEFRVRPLAPRGKGWSPNVTLSDNKRAGVRLEQSGNPFLPAPRIMVDFSILF